jgi:hypothetical protein
MAQFVVVSIKINYHFVIYQLGAASVILPVYTYTDITLLHIGIAVI